MTFFIYVLDLFLISKSYFLPCVEMNIFFGGDGIAIYTNDAFLFA